MEKKSIVNQVQKKLKEEKDKVSQLATTFRGIADASLAVQFLRDYKEKEKISKEKFAIIFHKLITPYKIHTVSEEHKNKLKDLKEELMPESRGTVF